jgi:hypothetical protein
MIQKTVLWGIRAGFFYYFPGYHTKIILGDFKAKKRERIFSNRQLGMRVYIRIVMRMVLE